MTDNNRGDWNKDVLGGKIIRGGRLFGTREYLFLLFVLKKSSVLS